MSEAQKHLEEIRYRAEVAGRTNDLGQSTATMWEKFNSQADVPTLLAALDSVYEELGGLADSANQEYHLDGGDDALGSVYQHAYTAINDKLNQHLGGNRGR